MTTSKTLEEQHQRFVDGLGAYGQAAITNLIVAAAAGDSEAVQDAGADIHTGAALLLAYFDVIDAVNEQFGTLLPVADREQRDSLQAKVDGYAESLGLDVTDSEAVPA